MTLSTPHIFYIASAYGITLLALCLFFLRSLIKWRKSANNEGCEKREA